MTSSLCGRQPQSCVGEDLGSLYPLSCVFSQKKSNSSCQFVRKRLFLHYNIYMKSIKKIINSLWNGSGGLLSLLAGGDTCLCCGRHAIMAPLCRECQQERLFSWTGAKERCSCCGRVADGVLPYDIALDERVAEEGWSIEGHHLMFIGICPACAGK